MFRQAVLQLYRALIGSELNRYIVLPPLASHLTVTTAAVANTYGAYKEIDDGTGTAVTGGYDGEAWIAGLSICNASQAAEYYDVEVAIGDAGHEVPLAVVKVWTLTAPADNMNIIWLPKPIRIGAVPARIAVRAADLNAAAKTIDVAVSLEQGL